MCVTNTLKPFTAPSLLSENISFHTCKINCQRRKKIREVTHHHQKFSIFLYHNFHLHHCRCHSHPSYHIKIDVHHKNLLFSICLFLFNPISCTHNQTNLIRVKAFSFLNLISFTKQQQKNSPKH